MTTTDVTDLIEQVRACGVELRADIATGRVIFAPKDKLPAALLDEMKAHKPALLAVLAERATEAVRWRVEVLRPQVPTHGPIYPVRLRNSPQTDAPGHCGICGDALTPGRRYRCGPCVQALEQVLNEQREDVPPIATTTLEREQAS